MEDALVLEEEGMGGALALGEDDAEPEADSEELGAMLDTTPPSPSADAT